MSLGVVFLLLLSIEAFTIPSKVFGGGIRHQQVSTTLFRRWESMTSTTRSTTTRLHYSSNGDQKDVSFYYEVLGVSKNKIGLSEKIIKAAYRRLAKQYHPDANPNSDTTIQFQELNHAYDVVLRDYSNWQKYSPSSFTTNGGGGASGYSYSSTPFSTNDGHTPAPPDAPTYYDISNYGFRAEAFETGFSGLPRTNPFGTGSFGSSSYAAWENNYKGPKNYTWSTKSNVKNSPHFSWADNFKRQKATTSGNGNGAQHAAASASSSQWYSKTAFGGGGSGNTVSVPCDNDYFSGGDFVQPRYGHSVIVGQDIVRDVTVDFKTAIFGGNAIATFTHLEHCATCNGTGIERYISNSTKDIISGNFKCSKCQGVSPQQVTRTINVTIHPKHNSMVYLPGYGDAGPNGGPPGDLYLKIKAEMSTEEHSLLQRLRKLHRQEQKQNSQDIYQHRASNNNINNAVSANGGAASAAAVNANSGNNGGSSKDGVDNSSAGMYQHRDNGGIYQRVHKSGGNNQNHQSATAATSQNKKTRKMTGNEPYFLDMFKRGEQKEMSNDVVDAISMYLDELERNAATIPTPPPQPPSVVSTGTTRPTTATSKGGYNVTQLHP